MSEFTQAFELHNMVPGPAGVDVVQVMYKSEDGILSCYGTTVPTDVNEFSPGCKFYKADDTGGEVEYTNIGTFASPNFQKVATVGAAYVADNGGPSPLIWDNADVLGVMLNQGSGYYFFTDLFEGDYTSAASLWTLIQRSTGSIANSVEQGGGAIIDCGADTAGQGVTLQMHGISVKPEPGTTIRMEWRAKVDVVGGRLMMGLGAVGTTDWLADDSIVVNADCAVFLRDDGTGDTDWSTQICDGSSAQETADAFSGSDTDYETYGIVIVGDGTDAGDSVTFYKNGVAAVIVTDVADMPDGIMVPTFEVNADGTDPVMVIDWIKLLVTNSTDGSRA